MLQLKGSLGIGGGHVLRTALALATVTRREFEIIDFVSADAAPGLRPRHIAALNAFATVCGATLDSVGVNSKRFAFRPGALVAGDYAFDASPAGADAADASGLLRALLPALALAGGPSTLEVRGATHMPGRVTASELPSVLAPTLRKFGFKGELGLARWGFPPEGGGSVRARVEPVTVLRAAEFTDRGPMLQIGGIALCSPDDPSAGERMRNRVARRLSEVGSAASIALQTAEVGAGAKMLFLLPVFERAIAGFTGVGGAANSAEEVADGALEGLFHYLQSYMVLERRLADDLLVYAALAEGRSKFSVEIVDNRMMTTIELLKRFLPVKIELGGRPGAAGDVTITGIGLRR